MGQVFTASCACGYESEPLYLGGGMFDFMDRCGAPAVCTTCSEVRQINAFEDASQWRCDICGGTVQLLGNMTPKTDDHCPEDCFFAWGLDESGSSRYVLPRQRYLCPSCGEERMTFVMEMFYD